MDKFEEIGKCFSDIANCKGLKDLTTDEIKWVIKLMQRAHSGVLEDKECKHPARMHDKCVVCGKTVGLFSQLADSL